MRHAFSSTSSCCDDAFKAVRSNHINCLANMNKKDLEQRDINGQTPLHVAAKLGCLQAIELLQHEAPATQDAVSLFGENPALVAASEGQTLSVELLFSANSKHALARAQQRDINGTTVLMAAVARGNNNLALWLLRRFGKNWQCYPTTFVCYRCMSLPQRFIRNAIKYDRRMVNFRDQFGCTSVFYAVQGGCFNCVKLLTEKGGADICMVSDKGQSLLHVACLAGHAHIVRWIINRSAANVILWTTTDNANAIHCASCQTLFESLILRYQTSTSTEENSCNSLYVMKISPHSGSVAALYILLHTISHKRRREILALRDSRGNTPLHLAAINNHTDAAQYLLENGAEPQLLNNGGQTAEAIACIRKNYQLAKLLSYWKERKQKRTKEWFPLWATTDTLCMDNVYSSDYWSTSGCTMPNSSSHIVPINIAASQSLQQNSASQYSPEDNFTTTNPEVIVSELRPITYVASDEGGRIYEDHSFQTDRDSLRTATKKPERQECQLKDGRKIIMPKLANCRRFINECIDCIGMLECTQQFSENSGSREATISAEVNQISVGK
ncbi:Espin [Dirofilaria immitis]|nr:Espin [Dirofilaria immitis]